jgi:hypothetical protein
MYALFWCPFIPHPESTVPTTLTTRATNAYNKITIVSTTLPRVVVNILKC